MCRETEFAQQLAESLSLIKNFLFMSHYKKRVAIVRFVMTTPCLLFSSVYSPFYGGYWENNFLQMFA